MDSEYDKKFEEMKKFIPFLDNTIKRLESTGLASNPRQAQLDKIRSLRDLLLVKKNRMKMENLLKCEQVLKNLYAKVEQRDMQLSVEGENASSEKDKTELNAVRNKLMSMVNSKSNVQETTETLPEIARASKNEEISVQGSKEPALFQRRPNKGSTSVSSNESKVTQPSKKNYTRVLQSPETDEKRWTSNSEKVDTQLFSRRSPNRRTELSSRKERKKSKQKAKSGVSQDSKVTNITLQVPEESLSSLNTEDILSRIINCSEGDVDINTLRELRTQILGELKKTGSKDDISDLILKSYKKKDKRKKSDEMEDGELSDSESETIKNVYSSIVVLDKDKEFKKTTNESADNESPRIQICLVINNKDQVKPNISPDSKVDVTDFENYYGDKPPKTLSNDESCESSNKVEINSKEIKGDNNLLAQKPKTSVSKDDKSSALHDESLYENTDTESSLKAKEENHEVELVETTSSTIVKSLQTVEKVEEFETNKQEKNCDEKVNIPLLNIEETSTKEVASEIDILQALKKEILSETSTALHANPDTPTLHQPKITKVQNSLEIGTKKRISIENYKAKSIIPIENKLLSSSSSEKDYESTKKQSLKLTEKECERFNFLSKLALRDSSDDEVHSLDDTCDNLAPKSPDHEDFADTGLKPPIIIPNDPVGEIVPTTESDIDMRKLPSALPNSNVCDINSIQKGVPDALEQCNVAKDFYVESNIEKKTPLLDPRIKRDVCPVLEKNTSESTLNLENISRSAVGFGNVNHNIAPGVVSFLTPNASLVSNVASIPVSFPNMSPAQNTTPVLSHNINLGPTLNVPPILPPVLASSLIGNITPIMTPNARTYEMTPSRVSMDSEDFMKDKHIYAPIFCNNDTHENENIIERPRNEWSKRDSRIPVWEHERISENRNPVWDESDSRNNLISRDKTYEDRHDTYMQGGYSDNNYRYNNRESYNRLEYPRTHNYSFGHLDCPSTPTPSFGRSDMPSTPVHPFGRSDYIQNTTNNRVQDPRRSRMSDYSIRDDEGDSRQYSEHNYNSHYYRSKNLNNSRNNYIPSRQYSRETSVGRYDRNEGNRKSHYRENSVGRSYENDYDDRYYSNHRSSKTRDNDYYNQNKYNRIYYQRGCRDNNMDNSKPVKTNVHYDNSKYCEITTHSNSRSKEDKVEQSSNKSFQKNSCDKDNNFNLRRRRAASVGRTFNCGSVGTSLTHFGDKDVSNSKRHKEKFHRAASVGREVTKAVQDFNNIKEYLKSFKTSDIKIVKDRCKTNDKKLTSKSLDKTDKHDLNKIKNDDTSKTTSTRYSLKNKRNPKTWHDNRENSKSRYEENKVVKHPKNHGIVYSHDNISKGTILGSGYGVKNYKIPKIKRLSVETEPPETIERKKDSTAENIKIDTTSVNSSNDGNVDSDHIISEADTRKNTECNDEKICKSKTKNDDLSKDSILSTRSCDINNKKNSIKNESDVEDIIEKRITRSSRTKIIDTDKTLTDTTTLRRSKKIGIIYSDSDSDEDNHCNKQKNKKKEKSRDTIINIDIKDIEVTTKENIEGNGNLKTIGLDVDKECQAKSINNIPLEIPTNSFKIHVDDLESFDENIVSDPVIDNINSLIDELDHDIDVDTRKYTGSQDFEKINMHLSENLKLLHEPKIEDTTIHQNESSKIIEEKMSCLHSDSESVFSFKSNLKPVAHIRQGSELDSCETLSEKINTIDEVKQNESTTLKEKLPVVTDLKNINIKSHLITTGKNDNHESNTINMNVVNEVKENQHVYDTKSLETDNLPDSTGASEKNLETDNLPDSTDASENIKNSLTDCSKNLVVDSKDLSKSADLNEVSLEQKLLLLLQDKTKMKELISKLSSDTSENDKIKKKLEKLSEIVSDEEEEVKENKTKDDIKISDIDTKFDLEIEQDVSSCSNNTEVKFNKDTTESSHITEFTINRDKQQDPLIKNTNIEEPKENIISSSEDNESPLKLDMTDDNKNVHQSKNNLHVQEEKSNFEQDKTEMESAEKILECQNSLLTETLSQPDGVQEAQKPKNKDDKNAIIEKKIIGKRLKKTGKFRKIVQPVKSNINVKKVQAKVKKPSRELQKLQDDLKDYMEKDILATTGIRMCRLAKLVTDSNNKGENNITDNNSIIKSSDAIEKHTIQEKDTISNSSINNDLQNKNNKKLLINRPGPKSKTKLKIVEENNDPYQFETDSINESNASESKNDSSSDSDNDMSNNGNEKETVENKKKIKKKRSARGWQAGIIKPKNKKKTDTQIKDENNLKIPDFTCFTDKSYCFNRKTALYSCRLCVGFYSESDIVPHYMKHHPHSEIPLSRLCPKSAMEAMKQCEEVNFRDISKMPTLKYACRFCFKDIKYSLEEFFWHVVSTHTGEYKQQCPECENASQCSFIKDIPPPPENDKGQLLGYICSKCNFTQVSMENLKTHVIKRHNNEETHVYTISLSVLSKKAINIYLKTIENQNSNSVIDEPRKLRSSRSKQSLVESSDEENSINDTNIAKPEKITNIQSKLTFEPDNSIETPSSESSLKIEPNKDISIADDIHKGKSIDGSLAKTEETINPQENVISTTSYDIFPFPHIKVTSTNGLKEYVCCINGNDNHYKTTLLISLKKHVQMRHRENWDGYCFVCKVIVTPQGKHNFKDCLNHYLDNHFDDLPVLDDVQDQNETKEDNAGQVDKEGGQKVTTANEFEQSEESNSGLPVIESVVSLNMRELPLPSPNYPKSNRSEPAVEYKYEEAQADIMSKKHRVVLDAMMSNIHLVQIFKCAGKFCSFTTDNAEEALLHASTHVRIGGEYALCCVYCDYDASGNAIDLVTHVFKKHGCCPYVCGICFYRAAASQLVQAHIDRVHPNSNAQVLRTTVVTGSTDDGDCLPRDAAVPFYRCADEDTQKPCNFRTYTSLKFREHLQTRHGNMSQHLCFICAEPSPTPNDLVRHLNVHGLKLYQCTRCVFGAENEAALLEHASAKHPYNRPTAYLRIITNKGGSAELKVLPLADLNSSKIPVTEIIPNVSAKNPVREAERARELETLIGETTSMIESISTSVDTSATLENTSSPIPDTNLPLQITRSSSPPVLPMLLVSDSSTRTSSPPAGRSDSHSTADTANEVHSPMDKISPFTGIEPDTQNTPNATKIEPPSAPDIPETKQNEASGSGAKNNIHIDDVVYCLDSDDDGAAENSNELSGELASTNLMKKVKISELFKCGKCTTLTRTGHGLKIHLKACYGYDPDMIPCAHCPMSIRKALIDSHYLAAHLKEEFGRYAYVCPICHVELKSVTSAQRHMKDKHENHNLKVKWKLQAICGNAGGSLSQANAVVRNAGATKKVDQIIQEVRIKRKRSVGSKDKSLEPCEKIKKFGPQDIGKLPINPILDDLVYCSLCEFSTKVKLNMVRHLQLHAQQQPVADTAPVNPVPHLETNEMHFDKMLNLASSSRAPDKPARVDQTPPAMRRITSEVSGRFPKYVPERQRLTCGAKDCSYISSDENMLKYHWETLHAETNDYHCVHCPPNQHLNGKITTARIISHLKMHDVKLYTCSLCSYYHYNIPLIEKHLKDVHKSGEVLIVREDDSAAPPPPAPSAASAPTMDLKPWQCGLCQFKSLLRPEVVEHCAKVHNSKMQYKCGYCAFRTSNMENIPKHQSSSHAGRPEEIFYYYYREGSILNESDGTPRWMKQKQKINLTPQVKSESVDNNTSPPIQAVVLPAIVQKVDLNLVKEEKPDLEEESDLCEEFGNFCEPNGLKYKCPLCQIVTEDTEDTMESHLYEELKCRKWGCPVCSYKAFHKAGFREHVQTEHIQYPNLEPHQLPVEPRIEAWISKLLEYQKTFIDNIKEKLAIQKAEIKRNPSVETQISHNTAVSHPSSSPKPQLKMSKEVGALFGTFGNPVGVLYSCPKCNTTFQEEQEMRTHLESELNRIRWYCNNCLQTFQTYHEAQFHCSAHCKYTQGGVYSRPEEATKDVTLRSSWVEAAVQSQTAAIDKVRITSTEAPKNALQEQSDNSLLVVRYEQRVSTPEEMMNTRRPHEGNADEVDREAPVHRCPYCSYITLHAKLLTSHVLKHYSLKACSCPYCGMDGNRKQVSKHQKSCHPLEPINVIDTEIPKVPPQNFKRKSGVEVNVICLFCRKLFTESAAKTHRHPNVKPDFGKEGDFAVMCCVCSMLHKEVTGCLNHHRACHPQEKVNYAICKLLTGVDVSCGDCSDMFSTANELQAHILKEHSEESTSSTKETDAILKSAVKRKSKDDLRLPARKVAKKSTSKQPSPFAKKSTTKLPAIIYPEEYTHYGTRPSTESLDNSVLIPFSNTMIPITVRKVPELFGNPVVAVRKLSD